MRQPTSDRSQGQTVRSGSDSQPDPVDRQGSAAAAWTRWRDWFASPAAQGAVVLIIYLSTWLATEARPLVVHPFWAQLDQSSMDPNFYAWCLRWWPYAILHGLNPLYSHQIGAPAGQSLVWVTTVPPLALVAAPLTLVAGGVVSFNLLTAIALPASAWAAFVLCRRLTRKFWPAFVSGCVFGFSAYEMNHGAAGQLNLTYSLLLPLMAYIFVAWRDESISTRTFVILLGITMAVQFYLFLETFAGLTALLAVAVVVAIGLAGRANRPEVIRLTKFVGLAYALAILLAAPYLAYALTLQTPPQANTSALDLASLVIPRPGRTLGLSWLAHAAKGPVTPSAAGYVGIPLLLVAILFAVTSWSSKLTRFLTCMLVIIVAASLGPALYLDGHQKFSLPWAVLWHLPIVRNAYPSRLMLFAFLVLAVMTALLLARTSTSFWLRVPLAVLVVAAIVLDSASLGLRPATDVPAYIADGTYRTDLAPGEIVVVVSSVGNAGMLWQEESGFYMRIAGGYVNQAISNRTDLPLWVQALSHPTPHIYREFRKYIQRAGVGAILLDANHPLLWVGIFWRMGLKGHRIGGVVVYPTYGCRYCHYPIGGPGKKLTAHKTPSSAS